MTAGPEPSEDTAMTPLRLALALPALLLCGAALAQPRNPLAPKPPPSRFTFESAPPVVSGIAWPRLDTGAVLCRTQEDLRRRSEIAAARGAGAEPPPGAAPNCRVIRAPTAIDIVERPVPSATQVRLRLTPVPGSSANRVSETGWTDAWLPEKAPR